MAVNSKSMTLRIQWLLVLYDFLLFAGICIGCAFFPSAFYHQEVLDAVIQIGTMGIVFFGFRFVFGIYRHIWRYEGVSGYLNLILSDVLALIVYWPIYVFLPIRKNFLFVVFAMGLLNLLASIVIRLLYRYFYKYEPNNKVVKFFWPLICFVSAGRIKNAHKENTNKINIAIVGAGRTGEAFLYDLLNNPVAYYDPKLFIDIDPDKVGKLINEIKVYPQDENIFDVLKQFDVKEIVIATPNVAENDKHNLFRLYSRSGCKVKVYDYSTTVSATDKRRLRDFDIEDLMPRREVNFNDSELVNFYQGRTVLITGGGGSIGSEIARQIYRLKAKKLILLDVYENGVYDLQQELLFNKIADAPELHVEICSIVNKSLLSKVFEKYRPEIVIHAAAHKHVPLMENSVCEAISNNILGTRNVINLSEEYGVYKFMMVSTDKAVNPTNVMGATKRFSEIMVKASNETGKVRYGSTRFGNVLGSAGSVVPLFRMQIANGGPVTVTDKRIQRYFMTIPEACNLVLQASTMTQNGELFVLDMGQPVKIWDLAENMVAISGNPDIEIIETGLRPGEKLYEEILLKDSDKHKQTDNELIFIEKESNIAQVSELSAFLNGFEKVCAQGDDDKALQLLHKAVPEFKTPDEINSKVDTD